MYSHSALQQHFYLCIFTFKCECVYLFNGGIHGKFIGFFLCLTEDDGPAVAATVHLDDITKHGCTLAPVACNG